MKRNDIQEIAARIHRRYPNLSLFQCAALATDLYQWLREIEREQEAV